MFKFVLIPANANEPVKEFSADKSGGLTDDALMAFAKNHFTQQRDHEGSNSASDPTSLPPAQRKALADQIRAQVGTNHPGIQSMTDDALLAMLQASNNEKGCEIIALTVPTIGNQHQAVSMYASPSSGAGAVLNQRATDLIQAVGHAPPPAPSSTAETPLPPGVYGDAFVGRAHDDEKAGTDWLRMDFTMSEASAQADWVKVAARSGGGGGMGNNKTASSTSSIMAAQQQQMLTAAGSTMPAAIDQQQQAETETEADLGYTWTQSEDEVEIKFKVPPTIRGRDVKVKFGRDWLTVNVKDNVLVHGKTGGTVIVDESTFTLQDGERGGSGERELSVLLAKREEGVIWPHAVTR